MDNLGKDNQSGSRSEEYSITDKIISRHIFNIAGIMFIAVDRKGIVTHINQKGCEILGHEKEDVIGSNWFENFLPERRKEGVRKIYDRLISGELESLEFLEDVILTGNNTERTIKWHNSILKDATDNIIGILSSGEDISDRVKAEQALIRKNQQFDMISEQIPGIIFQFMVDSQGKFSFNYISKSAEKILKRTLPTLTDPETMFDNIHADDKKAFFDSIRRSKLEMSLWKHDYRILIENEIRWVRGSSTPQKLEDGSVIWNGILYDITEYKNTERELNKSRMMFEQVLDNSYDAAYNRNLKTDTYDYLSPSFERFTGYSIDRLKLMPIREYLKHIHPDDAEKVETIVRESMKADKNPYYIEYRFLHKDGKYRWFGDMFNVVRDPDGNAVNRYGNVRDISEKKDTDLILKTQEERYRLLLESVKAGIGYYDLEGRIILYNKQAAAYLKGDPEDFEGKDLYELYGKKYGKIYHDRLTRAVKSDKVIEFEDEVELPSGKKWFVSKYNKIYDKTGKILGVQIVSHDVTSLKKTEESLRESEQLYREIFEGSRDGFVMVDDQGRFIDANLSYCKMLGYTLEELKEIKDFYVITPEKWREWEQEEIWEKRLLKKNYSGIYEKEYIRKNGEVFPVELQSYTVRDQEGRIKYLWGVARDISERKAVEEALKNSEERFRTVIEGSQVAICLVNTEGVPILTNPAFDKMMGYSKQELYGTNFKQLTHPEDLEKELVLYRELMEGKRDSYSLEKRNLRKDGNSYWIQVNVTAVRDEDSKIKYLIAIGENINERKKAETELTGYRENLQKLIKERTLELEEKNKELERFNKLFVGREFRIKELREKVKELEKLLEE